MTRSSRASSTTRAAPRRAAARVLLRLRVDHTGSAVVAFALLLPAFLFLLMAIFQIGFVFIAGQVLENVTSDLGRFIRTGQAQQLAVSQADFRKRFCDEVAVFMTCTSSNPLIDVRVLPSFAPPPPAPPLNEQGEFTTAPSYQLGKAEEIVLVRVFYQYPVWLPLFGATFSDLPNGKRLLAAAAAFSNEPFRLPAASAAPTN
jgi:Flp pilus assembly protein TadG